MPGAYIKSLMAEVAADEARRAEEERAKRERATAAAREHLTPLEERLAHLLTTIPIELQTDGLSLPRIQILLKGRGQGRHCSAAELGAAFRANRFVRSRRWRGPVFEAVWIKQG